VPNHPSIVPSSSRVHGELAQRRHTKTTYILQVACWYGIPPSLRPEQRPHLTDPTVQSKSTTFQERFSAGFNRSPNKSMGVWFLDFFVATASLAVLLSGNSGSAFIISKPVLIAQQRSLLSSCHHVLCQKVHTGKRFGENKQFLGF
jgi:hypothetical protein